MATNMYLLPYELTNGPIKSIPYTPNNFTLRLGFTGSHASLKTSFHLALSTCLNQVVSLFMEIRIIESS